MNIIHCCICGKEVSKRQSLFISKGRACRIHDETIAFLQDQQSEQLMKKANDNLTVLGIVSAIRCWHTIRGTPLIFLLGNAKKKLRPDLWKRIEAEIRSKPKLSEEEVLQSLTTLVLSREHFE